MSSVSAMTAPLAGNIPATTPVSPRCRLCGAALHQSVVDLGMQPLCESFLLAEQLNQMEPFYPLHVYVCETCFLVQLEEYVNPEQIFTEYAYFSSYSTSWVRHAEQYAEQMIATLPLNERSQVVELASNDGYLLQHFVKRGIPALGIEPAANVAKVAEEKGVPTLVRFFGVAFATELVHSGKRANLLLGNNVLAQVPDLNDFIGGMKILLAPGGTITLEFPHLQQLIEQNQFDTIYHEHFSYFSLIAVEHAFERHGLTVFDVLELPTHGGSLRVYGRHAEETQRPVSAGVPRLRERELSLGMRTSAYYAAFEQQVRSTKRQLLQLLNTLKDEGKSIVGYGAPGKGNTLLNYCGIRTDYLDYTVDRNPYKHGRFTPGTHIPIFPPERIAETKPGIVLILPWNLREEIVEQLSYVRQWGGRFLVPVPTATLLG
jgi:hypothetical protein